MQIGGHGKTGVLIGEYAPEVSKHLIENGEAELGIPDTNNNDTNPIIGYIQPACENSQWIMWFAKNGDAYLYQGREPNGGTTGEALILKARN